MLEMIYVMLARLTAEYLGGSQIPPASRAPYLARAEAVVAAVDSGQAVLRGDFEDMDAVLARLIGRQSRINELVRDEYAAKINKALA
jgi:hypothetical protein